MPADPKKIQALRASGTLNAHPERVRHPQFVVGEFFDPNDSVQLKYETIRAVEVNGQPIVQAAAEFGLSRPTIYQAQQNFQAAGMEGFLPRKRGPKSAHKLTPEVRQYLLESVEAEPDLQTAELVERVRRRFATQLHPRTVEKALNEEKKGRHRS